MTAKLVFFHDSEYYCRDQPIFNPSHIPYQHKMDGLMEVGVGVGKADATAWSARRRKAKKARGQSVISQWGLPYLRTTTAPPLPPLPA